MIKKKQRETGWIAPYLLEVADFAFNDSFATCACSVHTDPDRRPSRTASVCQNWMIAQLHSVLVSANKPVIGPNSRVFECDGNSIIRCDAWFAYDK
jgi:hypothetical protein